MLKDEIPGLEHILFYNIKGLEMDENHVFYSSQRYISDLNNSLVATSSHF